MLKMAKQFVGHPIDATECGSNKRGVVTGYSQVLIHGLSLLPVARRVNKSAYTAAPAVPFDGKNFM